MPTNILWNEMTWNKMRELNKFSLLFWLCCIQQSFDFVHLYRINSCNTIPRLSHSHDDDDEPNWTYLLDFERLSVMCKNRCYLKRTEQKLIQTALNVNRINCAHHESRTHEHRGYLKPEAWIWKRAKWLNTDRLARQAKWYVSLSSDSLFLFAAVVGSRCYVFHTRRRLHSNRFQ